MLVNVTLNSLLFIDRSLTFIKSISIQETYILSSSYSGILIHSFFSMHLLSSKMFPYLIVVFKLHYQWNSLFQLNLMKNPNENVKTELL